MKNKNVSIEVQVLLNGKKYISGHNFEAEDFETDFEDCLADAGKEIRRLMNGGINVVGGFV